MSLGSSPMLPSVRSRLRLQPPALLILLTLLISACTSTGGSRQGAKGYTERGLASWYGPGFHGKRAANGEIYDMHQLTAAHRTLPFETIVEVRNRDNGQSVRVRITDRGPFVRGRIIDLSHEAASRLEMIGPGVAKVEIRVVAEASTVTASRRYWIQAGAFRTADEAESLYRELREEFPDVQLSADGTWHRIRLGPFNKRKHAHRMQRRLEKRGIETFLIQI